MDHTADVRTEIDLGKRSWDREWQYDMWLAQFRGSTGAAVLVELHIGKLHWNERVRSRKGVRLVWADLGQVGRHILFGLVEVEEWPGNLPVENPWLQEADILLHRRVRPQTP